MIRHREDRHMSTQWYEGTDGIEYPSEGEDRVCRHGNPINLERGFCAGCAADVALGAPIPADQLSIARPFTVEIGRSAFIGYLYYASMSNIPDRALMTALHGNTTRSFRTAGSFEKFLRRCLDHGAVIMGDTSILDEIYL